MRIGGERRLARPGETEEQRSLCRGAELAEQCIGNTSCSGKQIVITPKMHSFISPQLGAADQNNLRVKSVMRKSKT